MDKPVGPTSHDLVRQVRRALGADAAGHTGTLDPFASGLMVVLLGRATRLAQYVEGDRKAYAATAYLGRATDTADATGEPLGTEVDVQARTLEQIEQAAATLRGPIQQRPPAFSAKKVDGRRAYDLARAGQAPALAPVAVTVHELTLERWEPPYLAFSCVVSAGTYVRALARDLGEALGCGAHLTALRRTAIGPLQVADAVPLADVTATTPVLPPRAVLAHLPVVDVGEARRWGVLQGQSLPPVPGRHGIVTLVGEDGALLGVGDADERRVRPVTVLAVAESA